MFDYIILGKIVSAYGIKGWVKILSFTESFKNIFNYHPWLIKKDLIYQIYPKEWKYVKNGIFLVKLQNIINRTQACNFESCNIIIKSSQLPKLKSNEIYLKDILNYQVFNTENFYFGIIKYFVEKNKNLLMVVYNQNFKFKNIFIPCLKKNLFINIDNKKKIVVVNWHDFYIYN